jgi:ribosome-associated toxin RatA of RatAB toxin-antitoxin module
VLELNSNLIAAEQSNVYGSMDILSNGFKLRFATGEVNASAATYIYAAFAENPFKYGNAR